jgi:hypothetical protein
MSPTEFTEFLQQLVETYPNAAIRRAIEARLILEQHRDRALIDAEDAAENERQYRLLLERVNAQNTKAGEA